MDSYTTIEEPRLGQIVMYRLSYLDIQQIATLPGPNNYVMRGHKFPMVITRDWGSNAGVNGTVFLDGTDSLWVTSIQNGSGEGEYSMPIKASDVVAG